jgi:hypothetical protein
MEEVKIMDYSERIRIRMLDEFGTAKKVCLKSEGKMRELTMPEFEAWQKEQNKRILGGK